MKSDQRFKTKFEEDLIFEVKKVARKVVKERMEAEELNENLKYTVNEMATYLGISRNSIYHWRRYEGLDSNATLGQIKSHRDSGRRLNLLIGDFRNQASYPVPIRAVIMKAWHEGDIKEISTKAIEQWYDTEETWHKKGEIA